MAETAPDASPSGFSAATQKWVRILIPLSLALLYFSLPHTLEDFAAGEPLKKGVPAEALALIVSTLIAAQAVGLFWLGQARRKGLWVHAGLGMIWPLAAGFAQLPVILGPDPYRSGAISVLYVVSLLTIGPAISLLAILGLRADR